MSTAVWSILFLAVYLVAIAGLGARGARSTGSFASYAAGGARLGVFPTALVAAACLTSTATFSINPGFVYSWGASALLAFSFPVALGVTCAFVALGPRIRETSLGPGGTLRVLTLPEWIGTRFESKTLRSLFAVLVLALFSYAVLVLVGAAYVASATLGVEPGIAAAALMAVVIALTAFGGTAAHASTNVAKGALLLGAALLLGGLATARLLQDGGAALDRLVARDAQFLAPWNAASPLFATPLDVLVFPAIMGFALACQPHIIVKTLYVSDPRAVRRTGLVTGALFCLLGAPALLAGLAARAELVKDVAQDRAASAWVAQAFPAPVAALIGVIMIAAAIGTLNALLLALGSTLAHDVARPLLGRTSMTDAQALKLGRQATVAIGVAVAAVSYSPPKLVWVTGVMGVYALVAAACPAVLAGCLAAPRARAGWVIAAAIVGPAVHGLLYGLGISPNPNATGSAGIATGLVLVLAGTVAARAKATRDPSTARSGRLALATAK